MDSFIRVFLIINTIVLFILFYLFLLFILCVCVCVCVCVCFARIRVWNLLYRKTPIIPGNEECVLLYCNNFPLPIFFLMK